ncbi:hypothetical protein RRG08_048556 [Elysia crispata]|uniref:Uncharacterized protein n=1 Tax=Elysia crispata TaxID=231223 RepID=A0AAE1B5D3_9GAST|nr:hypothetical protein RRG08_048556 [Elysia crispata]
MCQRVTKPQFVAVFSTPAVLRSCVIAQVEASPEMRHDVMLAEVALGANLRAVTHSHSCSSLAVRVVTCMMWSSVYCGGRFPHCIWSSVARAGGLGIVRV